MDIQRALGLLGPNTGVFMVMDVAEQVAGKLRELEQAQQQLTSLGKDQSRAVTLAIGGDGEARKELAALRQEIASVRRHIAEIEASINKILDRPQSDRAERIAMRQRHEQQVAERPKWRSER
jgi:hypothetical protein